MRSKSVLGAALVFLIRMYQRYVSPFRPPSCRYYPSCSSYAVTAVTRFGALKGGWLALVRLGRCHPWTPGGVDEVPQTWQQRHDRPEFVSQVFDAESPDEVGGDAPGTQQRGSAAPRTHHQHTT